MEYEIAIAQPKNCTPKNPCCCGTIKTGAKVVAVFDILVELTFLSVFIWLATVFRNSAFQHVHIVLAAGFFACLFPSSLFFIIKDKAWVCYLWVVIRLILVVGVWTWAVLLATFGDPEVRKRLSGIMAGGIAGAGAFTLLYFWFIWIMAAFGLYIKENYPSEYATIEPVWGSDVSSTDLEAGDAGFHKARSERDVPPPPYLLAGDQPSEQL